MQQNLRDDLFLIIYKQIPFMVYRFGLATIQFELLQTLLYKSLQKALGCIWRMNSAFPHVFK